MSLLITYALMILGIWSYTVSSESKVWNEISFFIFKESG